MIRGKKYRIHYRYRQWIGKPDPSGFGTAYIYSADSSWLHEYAMLKAMRGHQIIHMQKLVNGEWRTM